MVSTEAVGLFATLLAAFAICARHRMRSELDSDGPQHPVVWGIVLTSACAASVVAKSGLLEAMPVIVALACAAVCAATDLRTGYIFDVVTGTAALTVMAVGAIVGRTEDVFAGGATAGGLLLLLFAISRGRGMGLGDVKLAAVIGGGLGAVSSLVAIGVAFVLGSAVVCCGLLLRKAKRHDAIRFAPYLATGALITTLFRGVSP